MECCKKVKNYACRDPQILLTLSRYLEAQVESVVAMHYNINKNLLKKAHWQTYVN